MICAFGPSSERNEVKATRQARQKGGNRDFPGNGQIYPGGKSENLPGCRKSFPCNSTYLPGKLEKKKTYPRKQALSSL